MNTSRNSHHSLFFVLRVRLVELDEGRKEWRGEIESAASREKRYFREWAVLLDFVQAELQAACADEFPLSKDQKP